MRYYEIVNESEYRQQVPQDRPKPRVRLKTKSADWQLVEGPIGRLHDDLLKAADNGMSTSRIPRRRTD